MRVITCLPKTTLNRLLIINGISAINMLLLINTANGITISY